MSKLDLIAPDSPDAALSRRSLVQSIAGTALAMTILSGCGGSDDDDNNDSSSSLDTALFQFAMHLEYLEGEFYAHATTGQGLNAQDGVVLTGIGTQGSVTGGFQTNFTSPRAREVAEEILEDEKGHMRELRARLGASTPARPSIDLGTVPTALGLDPREEADYITLARAFTDVGTSAYLGGSPYLTNSALRVASRILAVEGFHAGNYRLQAVLYNGTPIAARDPKDQIPSSADPLTGNSVNFFATNENGLALPRTPTEVLRIVLNQPNAPVATLSANLRGGFFPAGLNLSAGNADRLLSLNE